MIDTEIIRILTDYKTQCRSEIIGEAIDLINRQKAEIERLKVDLQSMRNAANSYKMHYETVKVEAVKEFWDRLKAQNTMDKRIISVKSGNNLIKEMTVVETKV